MFIKFLNISWRNILQTSVVTHAFIVKLRSHLQFVRNLLIAKLNFHCVLLFFVNIFNASTQAYVCNSMHKSNFDEWIFNEDV